jgi:hypothetical protein
LPLTGVGRPIPPSIWAQMLSGRGHTLALSETRLATDRTRRHRRPAVDHHQATEEEETLGGARDACIYAIAESRTAQFDILISRWWDQISLLRELCSEEKEKEIKSRAPCLQDPSRLESHAARPKWGACLRSRLQGVASQVPFAPGVAQNVPGRGDRLTGGAPSRMSHDSRSDRPGRIAHAAPRDEREGTAQG